MATVGGYGNERTGGRFGVGFEFKPGALGWSIECQRAPDSGGSPGTWKTVMSLGPGTYQWYDELPSDDTYRHWRFRHIGLGADPGPWYPPAGSFKLKPSEIDLRGLAPEAISPQRDEPFDDDAYATVAISDDGLTLDEDARQTDGVTARVLAKGHQAGQAQDGDAVSFNPAFQNPPMVVMRGGISYEPRSGQWSPSYDSAKPQYDDMEPVNLSASGFTLRARLRQKGAQTGQSDNFSPSDNALDALDETTEADLDPAGAAGDQYTIHYSVMLQIVCPIASGKPPVTASITVAIDSNDGGGWVERAAVTYAETAYWEDCLGADYVEFNWTHEQRTITVSGLGVNDDIRIRIKAVTGQVYAFEVHGFHSTPDASAGVTYNTASDAVASKTPDAEDLVQWEALTVA